MSLHSALSNILGVARRHGGLAAARLTLSRLQPRVTDLELFGRDPDEASPIDGSAARLEMSFVDAEELREECHRGEWNPERLRAVEAGDRCLRQYVGGQLAGYTWVSVQEAVPIRAGVYLGLPADTAYLYKALTLPEHRGAGLQALRTRHLARLLAAEGRPRLLCYAHRTNFDSIRGLRRGGYRRVGSVRIVRLRSTICWSVRLAEPSWVVDEEP